jgi:hypothetical protein
MTAAGCGYPVASASLPPLRLWRRRDGVLPPSGDLPPFALRWRHPSRGWNDATLQSQAGNVKFNYGETDSGDYTVTCEFDTGTRRVVHHVLNTTASITDTVAYDAQSANRQNPKGKVTGFDLTAKNNEGYSADCVEV